MEFRVRDSIRAMMHNISELDDKQYYHYQMVLTECRIYDGKVYSVIRNNEPMYLTERGVFQFAVQFNNDIEARGLGYRPNKTRWLEFCYKQCERVTVR